MADRVVLPKYLLGAFGAVGVDAAWAARQAGITAWLPYGDEAVVPSEHSLRLWEVAAAELDDPLAGLHLATHFQHGELGLGDYLFTTAATLGEGLEMTARHIGTITGNLTIRERPASGGEVFFALDLAEGEGLARDLAMQHVLTSMLVRARRMLEPAGTPSVVCLRQKAPRRYREFTELFGPGRVEFDAATDGIAFTTTDLARPTHTGDPLLARLLRRYADLLPPLPDRPVRWPERLHEVLLGMLGVQEVSLEAAARRMATSGRTLQRRLAESGTTWRQELDRARQHRLRLDLAARDREPRQAARLAGYSDAASLRRAIRRWTLDGT